MLVNRVIRTISIWTYGIQTYQCNKQVTSSYTAILLSNVHFLYIVISDWVIFLCIALPQCFFQPLLPTCQPDLNIIEFGITFFIAASICVYSDESPSNIIIVIFLNILFDRKEENTTLNNDLKAQAFWLGKNVCIIVNILPIQFPLVTVKG